MSNNNENNIEPQVAFEIVHTCYWFEIHGEHNNFGIEK